MRDYDTMTAMEILQELLMFEQTGSIWGTPESPFRLTAAVEHEKDLVTALREAVIREASLGVGEIGRHWVGEDEGGCFAQTVITKNGADIEEDIEAGDYDLIPREVEK